MEPYLGPPPDSRTSDELISAALSESDDELQWELIDKLRWRGTIDVLHAAHRLCLSACAYERVLGAHVLNQFGGTGRTLTEQCIRILCDLLQIEEHVDVIGAALSALSFQSEPGVIPSPSDLVGILIQVCGWRSYML